MIDPRTRVYMFGLGLAVLAFVLNLVRRRRLQERYALLWLLAGVGLTLAPVFINQLDRLAYVLGFAYPPALLLMLAVVGLLFILVIFVTMVYGPIAAMLVELFPTKIRYTSMSLPYHIGNGWFGGLLPATSFAIVASTGDIYAGLWYPIIFASITAVVGFFLLPETKDVDISK